MFILQNFIVGIARNRDMTISTLAEIIHFCFPCLDLGLFVKSDFDAACHDFKSNKKM